MHFFAEAICILLRLYAGLCENISVQLKLELGLSLAIPVIGLVGREFVIFVNINCH